MAFSYEAASKLFRDGEFLALIQASGRSHDDRRAYEPRQRVIVANALALVGQLDAAERLAELDRHPPAPPSVRSQAESTFCVIQRRLGNHIAALHHAQSALFLAQESNEAERTAWAQLHLLRLLIEIGPLGQGPRVTRRCEATRRKSRKQRRECLSSYLRFDIRRSDWSLRRSSEALRYRRRTARTLDQCLAFRLLPD